jgi:membrane protease YdiL (CAAX protease family)
MLNRKPLIWFLIIAFSLAWFFFLLPLAFGPVGTTSRQLATTVSWSLAMWAPGLGAIIATRWVAGEKLGTLNLRRLGDWRAYVWALLLFPALAVVTGLLTLAFGAGELDTQFTAIKNSLAAVPGGAALPAGLFVLIQIAAGLTIGPLINTIFALGEELGWRGFLLPRLLPIGQWRAIALSGVIWGIWHAPAILQGHNYPSHPVAGVFMMVVLCVLLGAILSWLYLRTRSPWAPALAHGSMNAIAGVPLLFLTGVDISIGGTLASVIGWIPLGLFVAWLAWTKRLPVKDELPENHPALPVPETI